MFSEDEYLALVDYNKYLASQPQKNTFWKTGFGRGITRIWNWASNNPDEVANTAAIILNKNPNIDLLKAGYVGGYIPGYQPQTPQGGNDNNNNNLLLIILGVVVVVVLFFMFKNN